MEDRALIRASSTYYRTSPAGAAFRRGLPGLAASCSPPGGSRRAGEIPRTPLCDLTYAPAHINYTRHPEKTSASRVGSSVGWGGMDHEPRPDSLLSLLPSRALLLFVTALTGVFSGTPPGCWCAVRRGGCRVCVFSFGGAAVVVRVVVRSLVFLVVFGWVLPAVVCAAFPRFFCVAFGGRFGWLLGPSWVWGPVFFVSRVLVRVWCWPGAALRRAVWRRALRRASRLPVPPPVSGGEACPAAEGSGCVACWVGDGVPSPSCPLD